MKKAIIAIVALLILIAGGLGGLAVLGKGPLAQLAKPFLEASHKPEAASPPENNERAYDLGTYIVPIIGNHAIQRQIGMDLVVVVAPADADRVSGDLPRLQHALMLDLYDFIPRHADTQSAADREAIHQHLIKTANALFGDGAIHDIVIKSLYDR